MQIHVKNRIYRNCHPRVVAGKIGTKTNFPPGKIGTKTHFPLDAAGKIGTKTNFPPGKIRNKKHFLPDAAGKIETKTNFPQNLATINSGKIGTNLNKLPAKFGHTQ